MIELIGWGILGFVLGIVLAKAMRRGWPEKSRKLDDWLEDNLFKYF